VSIFDVRHQPRAHWLIQRALAGDRLPHAYIFHGPDGVGKETFAIGLARLLLCASPRERDVSSIPELADWSGPARDACGECEDCRAARAETHPDLHLIYRQLNRYHPDPVVRERKALDLGVDVVRHFVIDSVGAKPARGRAKVFIIREADRITPAAQNALLKTLEEPPPTTFLILLVASLDRLLETTYSRCQLIPFAPLPTPFVAQRLGELRPELPAAQAEFLARLAQGSLGAARQYAEDDIGQYHERLIRTLSDLSSAAACDVATEIIDDAKSLGKRYRERDPDASDTEGQRRGLKVLLSLMAAWYRDRMLASSAAPELVATTSPAAVLAEPRARLAPMQSADAIGAIATAERQLDLNANVQLCLESLLFKLARLTER
jgi:DNA polymerase-3 subunit delta'